MQYTIPPLLNQLNDGGTDNLIVLYSKKSNYYYRLTQDGNQRINNKWLYSKYDGLNRLIETGVFTFTSSYADLQGEVGLSNNYIPLNADPLSYT